MGVGVGSGVGVGAGVGLEVAGAVLWVGLGAEIKGVADGGGCVTIGRGVAITRGGRNRVGAMIGVGAAGASATRAGVGAGVAATAVGAGDGDGSGTGVGRGDFVGSMVISEVGVADGAPASTAPLA